MDFSHAYNRNLFPGTRRLLASFSKKKKKKKKKVSTVDPTPYVCVQAALKFRELMCGGEAKIRE
jgi:hypothetical protein